MCIGGTRTIWPPFVYVLKMNDSLLCTRERDGDSPTGAGCTSSAIAPLNLSIDLHFIHYYAFRSLKSFFMLPLVFTSPYLLCVILYYCNVLQYAFKNLPWRKKTIDSSYLRRKRGMTMCTLYCFNVYSLKKYFLQLSYTYFVPLCYLVFCR